MAGSTFKKSSRFANEKQALVDSACALQQGAQLRLTGLEGREAEKKIAQLDASGKRLVEHPAKPAMLPTQASRPAPKLGHGSLPHQTQFALPQAGAYALEGLAVIGSQAEEAHLGGGIGLVITQCIYWDRRSWMVCSWYQACSFRMCRAIRSRPGIAVATRSKGSQPA